MVYTDEEWATVVQEMPDTADPTIQQFLKGRNSLIAEEKKRRSDYSFRQGLSPLARQACEIVDRIRDDERQRIWTAALEEKIATGEAGDQQQAGPSDSSAAPPGRTVYPGQMFSHAKALMETTTLWKIVRRMPKGCLLHAHCDAMVSFDYVFDVMLATPGMHMVAQDGPLATPAQRAERVASFRFFKNASPLSSTNVAPWDPAYVAGTPVLATDAADAFPAGGRAGFLAWLKSRCTLSVDDVAEQHHGVDHIWRKFHACFAMLLGMIHYEPIWRAFLRQLMRQLLDDGVRYAEIRIMWSTDYYCAGSETPDKDYFNVFNVVDQEVAAFQKSLPPDAGPFWGLRFIWTALRSLPTRPIAESMDHCITTKLAFPHLIAGFDVVGQEDPGRTLRDLLPELYWFRRQCAGEKVELPFFFHAGECLGDGDATDNNVFDAVLLGTRRIGHGFSIYKHPLLIDLVREKRILIEACPVSNEVLRLCGSILSHPLPALLARGVPCALCNDDPAILGQDAAGMSHDFWQALQGWDNLGLAGLGSLAENSVRWAAFEDQKADAWTRDIRAASLGSGLKAQRLKEWSIEWEKFCLWVVTEFSEQYGGEDDE